MKGLDLGCGKSKILGCIGLDMNASLEGVDINHEMKKGVQLPFKDNEFSEIHLRDIIEHVDNIPWTLSEVHRVGIPNASVFIQYPHFSGTNVYNDVTHEHILGLRAFDHFIPGTEMGDKYQYYTLFNRIFPFILEELKPKFMYGVSGFSYNLLGKDRYERVLSRIFPISEVELKLKVLK